MKKTIALVVASLAVLMVFVSCGAKTETISMYDLNKAMTAVVSLSDMKYVSSADDNAEDLFANVSDMDYGKVNAFFINYAANGKGNADEIVVIQVKNKSDVTEAAASLKAHLQKRQALYATYDKTQVDKLSRGKVITKNDTAALIVADNADKAEKAFSDFLG